MDKNKECKICGLSFDYKSGWFTTHLVKEHNVTLKDYIIKYELDNKTPKCQCGFCDEDAPFFRGKFLERIGDHQKYKWLQEQYINKNGIPKCETCGNNVNWKRGLPNKYCSFKCLPNRWNQDKIKETVKRIYGVDNISKLEETKKR